ncbi:class I SAM-dependent methyltransferase [Paenibacillus medicaginis]|uniref:Class I SAM-dependent methyltransferase n=1 Tax=Paenibacillus medicaginis TaxID=1470560 RepID=A0ABV5BVE4_9BACL
MNRSASIASWDGVWKNDLPYAQGDYRFFRGMEKISIINKFVPFIPGKKILDVGCGAGQVCLILSKLFGLESHGIDSSMTAVKSAQGMAQKWNANSTYSFGTAQETNYPDNFFDYSLNFGVLEHSDDPSIDLRENYRVLQPGGWSIIVIPNAFSIGPIDRIVKQMFGKWPYGYQKEMTPSQLSRLLKNCGFVDVLTFARTRNWTGQAIKINKKFGWYLYAFARKPS